MPILTKDSTRSYFVHIPLSVGAGFYIALIKAGFQISNIGPRDGNFENKGSDGFCRKIVRETGVSTFPVEGRLDHGKYSLQFAPAKTWSNWGPFSDAYAVLKSPRERYVGLFMKAYRNGLYSSGQNHSLETLREFQRKGIFEFFEERVFKNPLGLNNQFRRLNDFLLPQVKLIPATPEGLKMIEDRFGIQDWSFRRQAKLPPVMTKSAMRFLEEIYPEEQELYEKALANVG